MLGLVRMRPSAQTANPSPCSRAKPRMPISVICRTPVVAMLNELAGELGAALGQDRVRRQDLDFGCWRPVNMAPGQDLGMSGGSTIGAEESEAPIGLRSASRAASSRHDATRRE